MEATTVRIHQATSWSVCCILLSLSGFGFSCGGSVGNTSSSVGGSISTGGTQATGGSPDTAGNQGTGGASTLSSTSITGGNAAGGWSSTGGAVALGGATWHGSTAVGGGLSSGGTANTGGQPGCYFARMGTWVPLGLSYTGDGCRCRDYYAKYEKLDAGFPDAGPWVSQLCTECMCGDNGVTPMCATLGFDCPIGT
jgi:hypothetical protein